MDTENATVLATLDANERGYGLLVKYLRGEVEAPVGMEDEIREDMAALAELLHDGHKTAIGNLSMVCRRYESLQTRLCDIFGIDPNTLMAKGPIA